MTQSAGVLLHRSRDPVEVLLVHPGGPFWAKKDHGAWSIPKGEFGPDEDPLEAARRELREETGLVVDGPFRPLGQVRQSGGKVVHAWALERDWDPARLQSNTFSLEWPPKSGRIRDFPEVDRAAWFTLLEARERIVPGQRGVLDALAALLETPPPAHP